MKLPTSQSSLINNQWIWNEIHSQPNGAIPNVVVFTFLGVGVGVQESGPIEGNLDWLLLPKLAIVPKFDKKG